MVRVCTIIFFVVSALSHGTEPPGVSPFAGTPLHGTLYDRFMQPFRDKVRQTGSFNGKPLLMYEHLDPARTVETAEYIRFSSLPNGDLVDCFIDNFLEPDADVDRGILHSILSNVVSRGVGRLEIELLMTKMSVRRIFWDNVCHEIIVRKSELREAVESLDNSKESVLKLLLASFKVSELSRFLINPNDSEAVTADCLANYKVIADFWHHFSFKEERWVDIFSERVGSGVSPGRDSLDSFIIDAQKGEKASRVYSMLRTFYSTASKACHAFSKIKIGKIREKGNCFFYSDVIAPSSINIIFDAYHLDGVAKLGGHYCYTRVYYEKTGRNVGVRWKTVYGTVFHEFGHALDWLEGRKKTNIESLNMVYGADSNGIERWSNDREFLNISGLLYDSELEVWTIDPVSCAAFCCTEMREFSAVRCFHKVPSRKFMSKNGPPAEVPVAVDKSDIELLEGFISGFYH